jgi:hypothetical protein
MMDFGSAWILREKKIIWKNCGHPVTLLGKCGKANGVGFVVL